ncbi:MAG TPA: hypothetical protein VGI78_10610 [Acetobacteraceae bacterium]|jgi:hypothetical protein
MSGLINYDYLSKDDTTNPVTDTSNWLDLRNKQMELQSRNAQQAQGQAAINALDPNTGQIDPVKYAQGMQAAGARAAYGAQDSMQKTQTLTTGEYNLHNARLAGANSALAQLLADYPNGVPQDAINATIAKQRSLNLITDAEAQQEGSTFTADPRANTATILQSLNRGQATQNQLNNARPAGTQTNVGDHVTNIVPQSPMSSAPYTGTIAQSGNVGTTATPGEALSLPGIVYPATQADVDAGRATQIGADVHMSGVERARRFGLSPLLPPGARVDPNAPAAGGGGGGVVNSDGTSVTAKPPRLLVVPGGGGQGGGQGGAGGSSAAPAPSGPPAPPGAPAGASTGPYTGGGIGAVLNPGGAPAAPATPPAPRSDLGGGVPVASANGLAPNVGAAASPSAAVPGDVAAIMRGVQGAQATPAVAGPQTAQNTGTFSVGPGLNERGEWQASGQAYDAALKNQQNYNNSRFPYEQALSGYGRGVVTGPGTDYINTAKDFVRARLQGFGVPVGDLSSSTALYDAQHKWLSGIIAQNPVAAGSDARLAQVLGGSATTSINQVAGDDMMKAGTVLLRAPEVATRVWQSMPPQEQAQYGTFLRWQQAFNRNVDMRALGTDLYNPTQKKDLRDQISKGSEEDARRFNWTQDMANRARIYNTQVMPGG